MPGKITLGASLMLSELQTKVNASLERIDLEHPGLNRHQSEKLHIIRSMLEDVEHQAREMARDLLKTSQTTNVTEEQVVLLDEAAPI